MRHPFVLCVLSFGLSTHCIAQNLDFEEPQSAWTAVTEGVHWDKGGTARSNHCLRLENPADHEAWAVSQPLDGFSRGKPVEISLAIRRQEALSDESQLALSLVMETGAPRSPFLWQGIAKADGHWHRLALQLVTGLERPRLAIGAVGAAGSWLLDDIRIRPVRLRSVTRPVRPNLVPKYADSLPAGWVPEGPLDLRTRTIVDEDSHYVSVGSLELAPQQEITVPRGRRTDTDLYVMSRSAITKQLQATAIGPPGWRSEPWEVTIRGKESGAVRFPLQSLLAGDTYVKLRFSCGTDLKATPLLVHSTRHYPALGVLWEAGTVEGADLAPFENMPAQFHQTEIPGPDDMGMLGRLAATRADVAITWNASVAEALTSIASLPDALWPALGAFGLGHTVEVTNDLQQLLAALRQQQPDLVALSPPYPLESTAHGLSGGSRLADALDDDTREGEVGGSTVRASDVIAVSVPPLSGSSVLRELVDGRPVTGPMSAWTHFDRARDMSSLRALLRANDVALPFLAQGVGGVTSGDPALDSLLITRAILHVFAMGANGVTVPAKATSPHEIAFLDQNGKPSKPLFEVYGELVRELAGVRALSPPPDTSVAGYLPGRPVTYRHFLRGDEGIIALWNNSPQRRDVAVDVRRPPMQLRLLRISYPGDLCQREYVARFKWDNLALHYGQPAVYIALQPLQVVILSLRLKGAHRQWLREVGPKPPTPPRVDPMDMMEFDKRVWGR